MMNDKIVKYITTYCPSLIFKNKKRLLRFGRAFSLKKFNTIKLLSTTNVSFGETQF
ncbi:MAG: hypothetical protein RLZZ292_1663 [Bacteroidota bacterium]|jgi:hypothetical protein